MDNERLADPLDEPARALDARAALLAALLLAQSLHERLKQAKDERTTRDALDGRANECRVRVLKAALEERAVGRVQRLDERRRERRRGDLLAAGPRAAVRARVVVRGRAGRGGAVGRTAGGFGHVERAETVCESRLGHVDVERARVDDLLLVVRVRTGLVGERGASAGRGRQLSIAGGEGLKWVKNE